MIRLLLIRISQIRILRIKTAQLPPAGTTPLGFERFEYANTVEDYERAGVEVKNPLIVDKANLAHGETLFLTYCAVCHGKDGAGDGPITKDRSVTDSRGTRALENFLRRHHITNLRVYRHPVVVKCQN